MPDRPARALRVSLIAAGVAMLLLLAAGLYIRRLLGPESLENILNGAIGPATNGVYVVSVEETDVLLRAGDLTLLAVEAPARPLAEIAARIG